MNADQTTLADRISRIEDFLDQNASNGMPADLTARVRETIAQIRESAGTPPEIPIALVGPARVGKSTLINSVLGVRVLTEDDLRFCTAAVTLIRYAPGPGYKAVLKFVSVAAWEAELIQCREALEEIASDPSDENSHEERKYYENKIRTVYQLADHSPIPFESLRLPADTLEFLERGETAKHEHDPLTLSHALKPFTTSESHYWPLIASVELSGPFEVLQSGVQLVDLPGLNDPNPAREKITQHYIERSPYIWLTFSCKAPLTKDLHKLLLEGKLLRQFLFEGKANSFAVIGTHSDSVEYEDDKLVKYGLPEDATHADLVMARNERLREDVLKSLTDIVAELAQRAGESEAVAAEYQGRIRKVGVFLVASKQYQFLLRMSKPKYQPFLTVSQTGIPDVLENLRTLSRDRNIDAHMRTLHAKADAAVAEIDFFFKNYRRELDVLQGDFSRRRGLVLATAAEPRVQLHGRLAEAAADADRDLEIARNRFSVKLDSAVGQAESHLRLVLDNWRGINHMTLRAIAAREGQFLSPSSGKRYDLPEQIAGPILNAIPFAWDHFFETQVTQIVMVFRERLTSRLSEFVGNLRLALLRGDSELRALESGMDANLATTLQSLDIRSQEILKSIQVLIVETRTDLYRGIRDSAASRMQPAFLAAREERGTGMKARMLHVIETRARLISRDLYDTIRQDLTEGLGRLENEFLTRIRKLSAYAEEAGVFVVENLAGPEGLPPDRAKLRGDVDAAISAISELHTGARSAVN